MIDSSKDVQSSSTKGTQSEGLGNENVTAAVPTTRKKYDVSGERNEHEGNNDNLHQFMHNHGYNHTLNIRATCFTFARWYVYHSMLIMKRFLMISIHYQLEMIKSSNHNENSNDNSKENSSSSSSGTNWNSNDNSGSNSCNISVVSGNGGANSNQKLKYQENDTNQNKTTFCKI